MYSKAESANSDTSNLILENKVSNKHGAGGSFLLPKIVFACFVVFLAEAKLYLSIPWRLSSSQVNLSFPHAPNSYSTKGKRETETINPQRSEAENPSNGEQAIQSSKHIPQRRRRRRSDKEVKQAVHLCRHARKAGKNLPRKGEEASGKWCSKLLRTFSLSAEGMNAQLAEQRRAGLFSALRS